MAETFNERIGFLVLDDVVNSFDLEHRGQLAELLVTEFSGWQLIVLTHDHQFFQRLAILRPELRKEEFTSWDYERGPRTVRYETGTILEQARRCLTEGDEMGAAQKGRRALEELLQEVCEGLGAPLPFRRGIRNDRREAIELLKALRRVLKNHAKHLLGGLDPLLKGIEADVLAALNPEAHATKGKTSATEVASALSRIDQLESRWTCGNCRTRVWTRGVPESCRCRCGAKVFPPVAGG